uniref:Uncharacterized protein n=1 Tax=Anguilla anguilla TaxID=7936 RepID=A0A0E9TL16_ANGAN
MQVGFFDNAEIVYDAVASVPALPLLKYFVLFKR